MWLISWQIQAFSPYCLPQNLMKWMFRYSFLKVLKKCNCVKMAQLYAFVFSKLLSDDGQRWWEHHRQQMGLMKSCLLRQKRRALVLWCAAVAITEEDTAWSVLCFVLGSLLMPRAAAGGGSAGGGSACLGILPAACRPRCSCCLAFTLPCSGCCRHLRREPTDGKSLVSPFQINGLWGKKKGLWAEKLSDLL